MAKKKVTCHTCKYHMSSFDGRKAKFWCVYPNAGYFTESKVHRFTNSKCCEDYEKKQFEKLTTRD